MPNSTYYMNFHFLRLDHSYHKLISNEKVVAKQDFLSAFDAMAHHMPIATYALSGLRSDCDMLIWRVSRRLEDLHAMSCRLQYSGIGKYLITARTMLGTVSGTRYTPPPQEDTDADGGPTVIGKAPYLIVQPILKNTRNSMPQNDPSSESHLHIADATGLDDPDHIVAFETKDPLEFRQFAESWKIAPDTPTYTCIQAGIKEIIDSFG
ncbi:MAG: chlorite dismutase family protein [Elusimicrobiota bacterium]